MAEELSAWKGNLLSLNSLKNVASAAAAVLAAVGSVAVVRNPSLVTQALR